MTITDKDQKQAREQERVRRLYQYEDQFRAEGFKLIAGVDEVGRGSLVGSLIVSAVILPPDIFIDHLNDSKKLTARRREIVYYEIIDKALAVSTVESTIEEIDRLNVYRATLEAMLRAVRALPIKPDFVLTDAMRLYFGEGIGSLSIVKGDAKSASIAAASIVAKVTRDRMADEWHELYPQYDFKHNRGYGTKKHLDAIKKYGATPIHRRTYEPVKSMCSAQLAINF